MSKLTWILVSLVLGCLITTPLLAADSSSQDAAVTAAVMAFPAAWAKHDAKAMAALWSEDGDLINPFGRVGKGRAGVEKIFADEQAGSMKSSNFEMKITSSKMIGKSVAIVDADIHITGVLSSEGKALDPMDHHVLIVLHREKGAWQYEAVRAFGYVPKP